MNTFVDAKGLVWANGGPETDDHLAFGGHEPYLIDIARGLLPEGGCFVDVGAHVGLYSLNLADKAAFTFAVEANPKTYAVLMQNIEANRDKFPDSLIVAENFAAWDKFEPLSLFDENGKGTGGSTRCERPEKGVEAATQGFPLDAALPEEPKVDLVKIDVEGAEAKVLKGMYRRIMRDRPALFIEMHDVYFGEQIRLDVIALMDVMGYEWNDHLKFGGSYYILARPADVSENFEIEIVRAGQ